VQIVGTKSTTRGRFIARIARVPACTGIIPDMSRGTEISTVSEEKKSRPVHYLADEIKDRVLSFSRAIFVIFIGMDLAREISRSDE